MPDFFASLKNLIRPQTQAKVPFLKEPIQRSAADQAALIAWQSSDRKHHLMGQIGQQCFEIASSVDHALTFSQVELPAANGFLLLDKSKSMQPIEWQHVFDHLRDRVLTLSYRLYTSDTKTWVKEKAVKTIERHYLKPKTNFRKAGKEQMDQQFGNVLIELQKENDKPQHIKFLCSYYNDRLFTKALPFDNLMPTLLG